MFFGTFFLPLFLHKNYSIIIRGFYSEKMITLKACFINQTIILEKKFGYNELCKDQQKTFFINVKRYLTMKINIYFLRPDKK